MKLNNGIVYRSYDDFSVLLNTKKNQYFELDKVGKQIIDRLIEVKKENNQVDILLDELSDIYPEIDKNELVEDIKLFLTELASEGILTGDDYE
jgi:hypothetical protein